MDDFVKSVIAHILGGESEPAEPGMHSAQTQTAEIYRPNYQRTKNNAQGRFVCIDTEPGDYKGDSFCKKCEGREEDLRWIKLRAEGGGFNAGVCDGLY